MTFHFFEGFILYDTYSHPSLNSFNLLCNLIHVCMRLVWLHNKDCSSIVTTFGSLENLTGSVVNYQKFRCHNIHMYSHAFHLAVLMVETGLLYM